MGIESEVDTLRDVCLTFYIRIDERWTWHGGSLLHIASQAHLNGCSFKPQNVHITCWGCVQTKNSTCLLLVCLFAWNVYVWVFTWIWKRVLRQLSWDCMNVWIHIADANRTTIETFDRHPNSSIRVSVVQVPHLVWKVGEQCLQFEICIMRVPSSKVDLNRVASFRWNLHLHKRVIHRHKHNRTDVCDDEFSLNGNTFAMHSSISQMKFETFKLSRKYLMKIIIHPKLRYDQSSIAASVFMQIT